MRALVSRGNELVLEPNYPAPTPVPGEALIRVRQVGICNTDLEIMRGYLGFQGVLGHEFVGIVEKIYGEEISQHHHHLLSKRVVGEINAACHRSDCYYCRREIFSQCSNRTTLGIVNRDGAFADHVLLPVENLHLVPDNVSDDEAVFVEPLAANFEILEQVHIHPTDWVVVLGDGKMGQLAAQVLSLSNCAVSMVGKHEEKLALVQPRGISTCLLEEAEQLAARGERHADVVVECTGSEQGLALALRLVRARGTVILKSTVAAKSSLHLAPIVINEIRVQGSRCGPFAPALRALRQHLLDVRPLIGARYSLAEALTAFQHAQQKGVLKVLVQP